MKFYVIHNGSIVFTDSTQAACATWVNANKAIFREGDQLELAQVTKTATITVTIVLN